MMKKHIINHNINPVKREDGTKMFKTLCGQWVDIHNPSTPRKELCLHCKGLYKNPLIVDILPEEITITTANDEIEVVHWVEDEWKEDPSIVPAIVNAIHLAYTDPDTLIHKNYEHMSAQYEIRRKMK